jgi:NAD+ synthase
MDSTGLLAIDARQATETIVRTIRRDVGHRLRRRGAVVGISGGVDSSVVAMLCARALGADRVLGLLMPERATDQQSTELGQLVAAAAGIRTEIVDISHVLEAAGCYRFQVDAIRQVFPDFDESWEMKLALPSILEGERLNVYRIIARAPDGRVIHARLPKAAYLELVAATNMKQRFRKQTEYFYADRLHYAVAGTPNRLEYDQGFFVKNGDGAADFKPIAHLYKTQVYALADYLGVPSEIRHREPTTDTYGLEQSQAEFFFSLPFGQMDACLFGINNGLDSGLIAELTGMTPEQVARVYRDIQSKRRGTQYLHYHGLLAEPVPEVGG